MKYSKNWQQLQALTFQSQLYQFLHQNRFTRKTLRSEAERVQYKSDISVYNPDMFVFVDETGTDRHDAFWRFACSLCGKPAKALNLFVRGQHVTAIGNICSEGVLDCKIVHTSVTVDIFQEFVDQQLLPKLHPLMAQTPKVLSCLIVQLFTMLTL